MARLLKEMLILASAALALFYLLMPSLLPDFIPLFGWMDEGAATLMLINALNYYGIDLTNLYGKRNGRRVVRRVRRRPSATPDRDPINAE